MSEKTPRRESDMGAPIREFLAGQGYTVRSEVNGCDITAAKGDELIVVEMKRHFSADLLIQAIERQGMADAVYAALPIEGARGRRERNSARWRGIERLLKRLELGLILVTFPDTDAPPSVEVALHPITEQRPRRRPKKRQALLREMAGRSDDYNVGGVTKREICTAYREQAIFIALCLERYGTCTPAALRALGAGPKVQSILHRNVYGWFERLDRGQYALRPQVSEHIATVWSAAAMVCQDRLNRVGTAKPPDE
jgi:hypothetical protein